MPALAISLTPRGKARVLWMQSRPQPLKRYLEDWRDGQEQGDAQYVLEVIYAYDDLLRQRKEVIPT